MTTRLTKDDRYAIMERAIDWLDENPERAIMGALARTEDGRATDPRDPAATCFCFLGRLCIEADLPRQSYQNQYLLEVWLLPLPTTTNKLASINDGCIDIDTRVKELREHVHMLKSGNY